MALQFPGIPGPNQQVPDLLKSLQQGFQTAYMPQMMEADMGLKKAKSQEAQMWANLLKSSMGTPQVESPTGQQSAMGNLSPMQIALLKAKGIDLPGAMNIRTPEQVAAIKTNQQVTAQGGKSAQKMEAADVSRRLIEANGLMPKEYTGLGADINMARDLALAHQGDKSASDRLAHAVAARKIMSEYGQTQLLANQTPATVHALEEQKKAITLGWPKYADKYLNNVPGDVVKYGNSLHSKIISGVRKARQNVLENKKSESITEGVNENGESVQGTYEKPPERVGKDKIRVYFDGEPHDIPEEMLNDALSDGATTSKE